MPSWSGEKRGPRGYPELGVWTHRSNETGQRSRMSHPWIRREGTLLEVVLRPAGASVSQYSCQTPLLNRHDHAGNRLRLLQGRLEERFETGIGTLAEFTQ